MSGSEEKAKHEKAVVALMTTRTISEAAKRSGYTERSLYRLLTQEEFITLYRQARWAAVGVAASRLQQSASQAVDTLSAVMTDKEASPSARVQAAKVCLDMALRTVELEDLEARISALERGINA